MAKPEIVMFDHHKDSVIWWVDKKLVVNHTCKQLPNSCLELLSCLQNHRLHFTTKKSSPSQKSVEDESKVDILKYFENEPLCPGSELEA